MLYSQGTTRPLPVFVRCTEVAWAEPVERIYGYGHDGTVQYSRAQQGGRRVDLVRCATRVEILVRSGQVLPPVTSGPSMGTRAQLGT